MEILLPIIGNMFSLAAFALVTIGVMKLFQVSTDIKEARDLLRDIRRNTEQAAGVPQQVSRQSPEPLVRSVNAASRTSTYSPETPETEDPLRGLDAESYAAALHAQVVRQAQMESPALDAEVVPASERRL